MIINRLLLFSNILHSGKRVVAALLLEDARSEFNWFRHVIVPVIGVLALPIWGFFAPGQQPPYNSFGWILLGLIAISVAWAVCIVVARPQATATLGTMIADE